MGKSPKSFNENSLFIRVGNWLFDCFFVSFIWLIFSGCLLIFGVIGLVANGVIPENVYKVAILVSIGLTLLLSGPASTGCFYTMNRRLREKESYTFRDFWESYKGNFRQGIGLSLILNGGLLFMAYLMLMEYRFSYFIQGRIGVLYFVLIAFQLMFIIIGVFLHLYCFPLLARFEVKFKDYLRLGFIMSIKHLPQTLLTLVSLAASLALGLLVHFLFFFLSIGLFFYLQAVILERVFKKYIAEDEEGEEEEAMTGFNLDAERQAIIDRYTGHGYQEDETEGTVTIVSPAKEEEPWQNPHF